MRIVATAEVPPVAREAFAPLGEIVVDGGVRRRSARGRGGTDRARHARSTPRCSPGRRRLRAIARTGAGYDNLDVEAATRRGVPIVYAPGRRAAGRWPRARVALILAAAKRLRELGEVCTTAAWASRYEVVGLDLDGALPRGRRARRDRPRGSRACALRSGCR